MLRFIGFCVVAWFLLATGILRAFLLFIAALISTIAIHIQGQIMNSEITPKEQTIRALKGWYWVRTQHGSLFDRGSADSYYGRLHDPHYGGVGGNSGKRVEELTSEEIAEYIAGYTHNEQFGDKKSYE